MSELVKDDYLSNAVALNSASFNVARMIGPAVAGVLTVAVGPGWVFMINTLTFLAMLGSIRPSLFPPCASNPAPPLAKAASVKGFATSATARTLWLSSSRSSSWARSD
ncbi:hypothetical protein AHiyo8_22810 [Arthrobacter sp. Hiyo8]|nr:hypothetical protein AHiyo8_22810 [Arthrobacter sp. Hiyo8]